MTTSRLRALAGIAIAVAGAALAGAGVVGATGGPRSHDGQPGPGRCLLASAAGTRAQGQPSPAEGDARRAREGAPREGATREGAPPRGVRGPMSMPPFDFGLGGAKNRADLRLPGPREWAEVRNFMSRHSPLRQAAVDELPEGEKKDSIKKFVFARYRSLQALQKRDPAAYEQRLKQLTIEDQIFGTVSNWGGAGAGAEPQQDRQQLRRALRQQVQDLVDLDLGERRRRVEWLRKELADQSALLERDEKDRDGLIDRRVNRFAQWADGWAGRRARQQEKDGTPGDARPGEGTPNVEASPSRQPTTPGEGQKQD